MYTDPIAWKKPKPPTGDTVIKSAGDSLVLRATEVPLCTLWQSIYASDSAISSVTEMPPGEDDRRLRLKLAFGGLLLELSVPKDESGPQ